MNSLWSAAHSESQPAPRAHRQATPAHQGRLHGVAPEGDRRQDSSGDAGERIRVVVVDDHTILRDSMAMLLEAQDDMEMVGEAANGEEAIKAVDILLPDIVLMDLFMPEMDGFEAMRIIRNRHPKVAMVALTMYDDEENFFRALEAGASGFVPKRAASSELMAAIRSVHKEDVFLHPSMAKALLTKYLAGSPAAERRNGCDGLTEREQEVLRLIGDGLLNRDIAERLGVSESTVERHRANIMEKLDLHSRTELVKYAIRKGIVKIERSGGRSKGSTEVGPTRRAYSDKEV